MHHHSIVLRAANSTLADGEVFARYLDQAAEGFFRFMLGPRAGEIVATAFIEPDHDLSFQNVTFAELDANVVGMVSGYTAEQHRRSSSQPLKQAAGKWNVRLMVVSVAFAPLLRVLDAIGDDEFYLQAIAVNEEVRGEGVGSTLMDWIEDRAVASGSSRITLDVSATNDGARKLYERRGMTVQSRWPKRWALPKLKLLRMTKPI